MVSFDDETDILRAALKKHKPVIYFPGLFLNLTVEVIQSLLAEEQGQIAQKTCIKSGLISRDAALSEGRCIISYGNTRQGIQNAVQAAVPGSDKSEIREGMGKIFPGISSYLETQLEGIDLSEIVCFYHEKWGNAAGWEPVKVKKLITSAKPLRQLEKLAGFIYQCETIHRYRIFEVITEYLSAYDRGE